MNFDDEIKETREKNKDNDKLTLSDTLLGALGYSLLFGDKGKKNEEDDTYEDFNYEEEELEEDDFFYEDIDREPRRFFFHI